MSHPITGLPFSTFAFENDDETVRFTVENREWLMDRATYQIGPAPTAPAISPAEWERVTPQLVRRGFPRTMPDVMEAPSPDGRWFVGEP